MSSAGNRVKFCAVMLVIILPCPHRRFLMGMQTKQRILLLCKSLPSSDIRNVVVRVLPDYAGICLTPPWKYILQDPQCIEKDQILSRQCPQLRIPRQQTVVVVTPAPFAFSSDAAPLSYHDCHSAAILRIKNPTW